MRMLAPRRCARSMSVVTSVPPTTSAGRTPGSAPVNDRNTSYVCRASSRVGEMTMPPTWLGSSRVSRRSRRSTTGTTKAIVFPLPVHASTHTSLLPMNSGMTADWTGVAVANPIFASTPSVLSDSAGVKASNRLAIAKNCRGVQVCSALEDLGAAA